MSDTQQDNQIQQLDSRVRTIESVLTSVKDDLASFGVALKETTIDLRAGREENRKFLDEIKDHTISEIGALKDEIRNTQTEIGRPNWNFWGVAVVVIAGFLSGGYYIMQQQINQAKEMADIQMECHDKDFQFLKEIIELKTSK